MDDRTGVNGARGALNRQQPIEHGRLALDLRKDSHESFKLRIDLIEYLGFDSEMSGLAALGRLASGLYTLRMTLPDRIEVRRVVKQ